jgi:hemerythrin-like domain-containing protein
VNPTYPYRTQNARILDILGQLEAMLDAQSLRVDPRAAHLTHSYLLRWSLVHLAMEETTLFPELKRSADPALRRVAARFQCDLKSLEATFTEHDDRYARAGAIQRSPEEFITRTCALAQALRDRVEREESELFALIDRTARPGGTHVNPS